jgi:hypothetical protein
MLEEDGPSTGLAAKGKTGNRRGESRCGFSFATTRVVKLREVDGAPFLHILQDPQGARPGVIFSHHRACIPATTQVRQKSFRLSRARASAILAKTAPVLISMSPKKKFGVHDERIFAPPWFLAARLASSEAKVQGTCKQMQEDLMRQPCTQRGLLAMHLDMSECTDRPENSLTSQKLNT